MTPRVGRLMRLVWLVAGVVLGGVGAATATEPVVALTESQNGRTVEIAPSQSLEIRLPVQGGTGYSWELEDASSTLLRLVSSNLMAGEAGVRPGSAQIQLLTFSPITGGSGDIVLRYRRPWEKDSKPARTFRVHVVVRQGD